jgi:uncharacterized protein (TIGR02118 family)
MTVAYFVTFTHPEAVLAETDRERLAVLLAETPDLEKALIFTPARTHDPYLHDGAPPALMLELYFADVAHLEAALQADGHLQALADPATLPSLAGAHVTQQAMLMRRYPVPEPGIRAADGAPHCTYLVAYEIEAEDSNAWHRHYVTSHPPIMARFPGIREIEICTRIDWICAMPWARADAMQRNKVVFDSEAALNAALNSDIRHEMRADFHRFPPFAGRNTHYPMHTRVVTPA